MFIGFVLGSLAGGFSVWLWRSNSVRTLRAELRGDRALISWYRARLLSHARAVETAKIRLKENQDYTSLNQIDMVLEGAVL